MSNGGQPPSAFKFRKSTLVDDDPDVLACLAHHLHRLRGKRSKVLPKGLFGEPGWDILLDLYVHKRRGKRVSVTSLCVASGVPPTTALRWIGQMEASGLIKREPDQHDSRRIFLSLTIGAEDAMQRTLREIFDTLRGLYRSDEPVANLTK